MSANKAMTTPNTKDDLTYLKDYREPDYFIDKTELHFDIQEDITVVSSTLHMRRNAKLGSVSPALVLDGVNLDLRSLVIDDKTLDKSQYSQDEASLSLNKVPERFTLHCETAIKPKDNTALVGLYQSNDLYCTQCEPQGFRHITYYLDRPDVLSEFTVTVEADKALYPVLLANGNLIEQGVLENNLHRHWATWHDPFKKPCALFAMVAGNLKFIEDTFTTCSGRVVTIRIFTENAKDLNKCRHAMGITKQAMRWDEEVYGREYDLDVFMIAMVADLNVGGMENKGLNVYRLDKLLVDPLTTTDADLQTVTETVAHEYFHNWSGNRVASRDWFQLSLKEGFTTYRGLQFNQDKYSTVVKRIEETQFIRTTQFAEDASPLAHPIRPEAYRAIWNFYTPTVYQKGAEVVRMLASLLGPENYRKGADLFFQRHDGQAVTTEEFIVAMEAVSNRDLTQFRRWYSQTGTPWVEVSGHYQEELSQFTLTIKQTSLKTPNRYADESLLIPVKVSLVGQKGAMPIVLNNANKALDQTPQGKRTVRHSIVLEVTEGEKSFVFDEVNEKPVPLLFQDFSAPVKWTYGYSLGDLLRILRVSGNDFSRWEASQLLWVQLIDQAMGVQDFDIATELPIELVAFYTELLAQTHDNSKVDQGLIAKLLTLPSEAYLTEWTPPTETIEIDAIHKARSAVKQQLAIALKVSFKSIYGRYEAKEPVSITVTAMASRALRNLALDYLVSTGDSLWVDRCYHQFVTANNMTDTMAALTCLVNSKVDSATAVKEQALEAFYTQWLHEPLMVNQWFGVQACCPLPDTLVKVKQLLEHPAFDIKSPNQVRVLIGNFCTNNLTNFHHIDGSGYCLLIDQIITLDDINPQMASSLLVRSLMINWRRYDITRQQLIESQLQRLLKLPNLSTEVFEVVNKCL